MGAVGVGKGREGDGGGRQGGRQGRMGGGWGCAYVVFEVWDGGATRGSMEALQAVSGGRCVLRLLTKPELDCETTNAGLENEG